MSHRQPRGKPFRGSFRGKNRGGGHHNRHHPYDDTNQHNSSNNSHQYRQQLDKIPERPAPKVDFDDVSSQSFEIAECNADLLWIAQLKRYLRNDGKYTIKFPDVRGYPGEQRLRTTLQASIAACEQTITADVLAHLQSEEQTIRQERQRLMAERADELGLNHDNTRRPQQLSPRQPSGAPDEWLKMGQDDRNAILDIIAKTKAKQEEPQPQGGD